MRSSCVASAFSKHFLAWQAINIHSYLTHAETALTAFLTKQLIIHTYTTQSNCKQYCRMTNCDKRLWLVKIRSRAVRHNWVLKHTTCKPCPPECQCDMTVDLKVNVTRCVAVWNVTRLVRLRKFFHLSFLWFFGIFTDRHVTKTYLKLIFKKKVI